jgi:transposase, IS5 family
MVDATAPKPHNTREENHVRIARKHKIIRRYAETDASVHDSQKLDEILNKSNSSSVVWADSASRSAEMEAKLKERGYKRRIHRRGTRNHPLTEHQQVANTARSRVRARVEHVFADQENGMSSKFVRTIGMARAAIKIGMMNLVYGVANKSVGSEGCESPYHQLPGIGWLA